MKNVDEELIKFCRTAETALGICVFFPEDPNAMWKIWKKIYF
jgi:hypothetical protein